MAQVLINPEELRARHKRMLDDIERRQKDADALGEFIRSIERFVEKPPDKEEPKGRKRPTVPRPEGIPTTFEMVEMILKSAEREGKDGLTSRELMDQIRAKYWPGVRNGQILPSIFGYRNKRLLREGDKWKRMKK